MEAPNICILCDSTGPFSSEEHVVPHSLGNDIVILARGWVCDFCNNICSAFESRVLSTSIIGLERCRLGVITKKRKPAKVNLYDTAWFAEPDKNVNIVTAEADWKQIPILDGLNGTSKMAVPLHDKSNYDIARLLLKIGIELISVFDKGSRININRQAARDHILGIDVSPWPYFVLRDEQCLTQLTSIFEITKEAREYINSLGFDLYFHEIQDEKVLFFKYGQFIAAVSITSRSTDWSAIFSKWEAPYVGCPSEFSSIYG